MNYDDFCSSDMIEGSIDGREFVLSEVTLTERDTSYENDIPETTDYTVFSGVFAKVQMNYSVESEIFIKPEESSSIKKFAQTMFGKSENIVNVKDPEFERFFEIYCENKTEARKVITMDFIRKLVDFRNKYNRTMYFRFYKNDVYILISNNQLIKDKTIFEKSSNSYVCFILSK